MNTLLDEIIAREGHKDTNNPSDSGGRTKFGISEKWHPEAWKNGPPTIEVARDIYFREYIVGPRLHLIQPEWLMAQVADMAVLSGPSVAIRNLQAALGVQADGVIGPVTLAALKAADAERVNNAFALGRAYGLVRIAQKRPKDVQFLYGWVVRALSFVRP